MEWYYVVILLIFVILLSHSEYSQSARTVAADRTFNREDDDDYFWQSHGDACLDDYHIDDNISLPVEVLPYNDYGSNREHVVTSSMLAVLSSDNHEYSTDNIDYFVISDIDYYNDPLYSEMPCNIWYDL